TLAAEGVFERRGIVDFDRHYRIAADRLEQTGHVAGRDRIPRLGAPVLARVAEIGRDGRDARGAGIFERADEEQQPTELVVGAFGGAAVEALHNINIGVADVLQWAALVLAVFEIPLLVRGQRLSESLRDAFAEFRRGLQRKKPKPIAARRLSTLSR